MQEETEMMSMKQEPRGLEHQLNHILDVHIPKIPKISQIILQGAISTPSQYITVVNWYSNISYHISFWRK